MSVSSSRSVVGPSAPYDAARTTLPARYVRIPQRLLHTAAYHPLPVGVYSLIARLFLVSHAPVPLSATDVTRYDSTISRGAAQRALSTLFRDGWRIGAERAGHKSTYLPAWGRINGTPLPWTIGATCLERPRHIRAVCLDLRLLDLFLGKLTPHPTRAAVITRYVTAPLLSLADVGSYALLLGGLPGTTPRLSAWDLVRDEQPCPLPDDMVILALASQHTIARGGATTLTVRGPPQSRAYRSAATGGCSPAAFFVPPEVIADWPVPVPASLIAQHDDHTTSHTAVERHIPPSTSPSAGITWESVGDSLSQQESSPSDVPNGCGGGAVSGHQMSMHKPEPKTGAGTRLSPRHVRALPDTETARVLSAINVLPTQIIELADLSPALVRAAISDGQARPQRAPGQAGR